MITNAYYVLCVLSLDIQSKEGVYNGHHSHATGLPKCLCRCCCPLVVVRSCSHFIVVGTSCICPLLKCLETFESTWV